MSKNLDTSMRRPPEGDPEKVNEFVSGEGSELEADDSATADTENSDSNADVSADDPGVVELEDGTLKRRMTVYLDPADGKRVKVLAALEDRKISDVLAKAVEQYLDGRDMPDL
jgi:hypothetical protein